MSRAPKERVGLFARMGDGLIRFYQKCISPLLPARCRFYPCCSAYAREAIRRFGLLRGSYLGLRRLLRCNPFCKGGVDPVPDEFRWFRPQPGTIHHKEEV